MQRDKEEAAAAADGDAPIAAFAVSKGGVVIKHIFLNAPPPELTNTRGNAAEEEDEEDPPVTVGRHPDCHVLVDHPSVSRFHLELRARRRHRRITVTDLSSVHGTWVSGRRIPPNTPVDLAAGDALRLGASRREYRLLWLSLREAFEMESPLAPLIEEDKEEARGFQESSDQIVPGQRDLVGINTHKDTSQKIVSENIPSALSLPEFTRSFYKEQPALPRFLENSDDVTNKKLVDKSPISESFGSLIKKDVQDASSQVSKRAKLKSVKSLRIDTGRNMDRSSTLSYSCQKEDPNDIVVCSQNCGIQCAACIALLGISEFEGTYQNDDMTAEEKGHMNPPANITMEGNNKKATNPESYVPQDSVDDKSEKTLSLLHPVQVSEPLSENTSAPEVKEEMTAEEKGHMNPPANITMEGNKKKATNPESYVPQDSVDDKSEKTLSLLHPMQLSRPLSENTSAPEVEEKMTAEENGHTNPPANITIEGNRKEATNPECYVLQDSVDDKSEKTLNLLHPVQLSEPLSENTSAPEVKEEMTAEEKGHVNPPANITMEGNKKMAENPESYVPQDSVDDKSEKTLSLMHPVQLSEPLSENTSAPEVKLDGLNSPDFEGTYKLDSEEFQDNAEITPLDKESITPYFSEITSIPEVMLSGLSTPLEESISNNENMASNKISEGQGPEDSLLEGTICWNPFGDLDAEVFQDNEEISSLDKENITPYVSGNIVMERSNRSLKPDISQELMDSISPLHLEHDIFSEKEKSMLNIANEMGSNEPTSGNLSPLILADTRLQQNQVEFMPVSHLEFKADILSNSKNSALGSGKNDAISPVRQEDLFSDKENVTPVSRNRKSIVRRVLGSRMDDSEERAPKWGSNELSAKSKDFHAVDDDVFYSDKENLTPLSSQGMKARKGLQKNILIDAHQDQEALSEKENLTPLSSAARETSDMSENRARIESAITKKRVADRLPFQTLLSNSPLRPTGSLGCNCAVARAAAAAAGDLGIRLEDEFENLSRNHQESRRTVLGMKTWTMVADTDSLLDDESRKSIMLLKGIKGTQLIIPRIVIRELDSMKQREGLFRRSSKATSILKWIDECMESESWWIHVQSSSEMFPVAPTPPATPSAQLVDEEIKTGCRSFNPMALFSPRSFADIESPKPEDRVLDCALIFKKLRSDQNMVILSDSITLKIKAMAEGLPCEGAKEFRESLMNPCSDRFMWTSSVPRGWAWSRLDEATLAQNYYDSHHHERRKKRAPTPRPLESAAAKGLKLILRHNSGFAQAASPHAPLASA